jgi:hypothetical protein
MKTTNHSSCKLIVSIFLQILFTLHVSAQEVVSESKSNNNLPFTIKKGLELTYEVTIKKSDYESFKFNNNPDYNFIVKFTEVSPTRVSFDWKMTEPINYSGTLTMLEKALNEAVELYNYFYDKSNDVLTDQTSVLLSKRAYNYMLKNNHLQLDFGKGLVKLFKPEILLPKIILEVNNRAELLPKEVFEFENPNDKLRIEFVKLEDYILILYMRTYDFTINLRRATF